MMNDAAKKLDNLATCLSILIIIILMVQQNYIQICS